MDGMHHMVVSVKDGMKLKRIDSRVKLKSLAHKHESILKPRCLFVQEVPQDWTAEFPIHHHPHSPSLNCCAAGLPQEQRQKRCARCAVLCRAVPCRAVLCQLNSVHDNQHCLYCVFATWICKQSEVSAYTECNLSMLNVTAAVCPHCA